MNQSLRIDDALDVTNQANQAKAGAGDMANTLVDISATSCGEWQRHKENPEPHRELYEREGGTIVDGKGSPCCITKWGNVLFINGNKKDIRRENLVLVLNGEAMRMKLHEFPKTDGVFIAALPMPMDPGAREMADMPALCRNEGLRADHKRAKDFDETQRLKERAAKALFDPNYVPEKHCGVCGSMTTGMKTKSRGGGPNWYRLRTSRGRELIQPGEEVQCCNCYHNQHARKRRLERKMEMTQSVSAKSAEIERPLKTKAKVRTVTQKIHARRPAPVQSLTGETAAAVVVAGEQSK